MEAKIQKIIAAFDIPGTVTEMIPWGNGLINHTFRIRTEGGDYLLQQVNERAYPHVEEMLENIYLVTEALRKIPFYLPNGERKKDLQLITLKDGRLFYRDEDNIPWRCYNFMTDSFSLETTDDPHRVYQAGLILGQFHYLLRDFPVEKMHVHVPDFHNPEAHYQQLLEAAEEDPLGRRQEVETELQWFAGHTDLYGYFNTPQMKQNLPIRVDHNDPKINNIMFDNQTGETLCMVDLDTMMPGILAYDFGDGVRSIMCTGKDTGPDMDCSRLIFQKELFESYLKGFLDGAQGMLTPLEEQTLLMGAVLILIENAMRYLEDYLRGDIYFKIKYPTQNLIKTRMHLHVVHDLYHRREELSGTIFDK